MTRLEIGLTQEEPAWLQILGQERVNYRLWDKTFTPETPKAMIINHSLSDSEVEGFRSYVQAGAGVLTDFPNLARLVPEFKYAPLEVIRYIQPEAAPLFDGVGLIDLELPGFCSNQANSGRLDNQGAALYCEKLGRGYVIGLPFDVSQALSDKRRALKAFDFDSNELPYEECAVVTRHYVRRLCVNCLRELCTATRQLYVHLWYYPEFKRTAFAFRVDGDSANRNQFEAAARLATKHGLKFSWYVNAKAQRSMLDWFAGLAGSGHDVQLHCYEHRVYDDAEHNLTNLRTAKEVMERAGLKPVGFVGPFGHWNEGLNQALEQTGFRYSSEFGLAYDDFPFHPILPERCSEVMQVPIHPICSGRLLQARLRPDDIISYYKTFFRHRYGAGETLFIYDHPHRIAELEGTFDAIFKIVAKASDVWQTTLTEFQDWWRDRAEIEYEVTAGPGELTIDGTYDIALALHVIDRDREVLIPMTNRTFDLDECDWKPIKRNHPFRPEMVKARKLGRHLWLREQVWKAGRLLRP